MASADDGPMPPRDRAVARGARISDRIRRVIGLEFRSLRRSASLTQRELGRMVGVSASMICRLEHGILRSLSVELMARIAAVLGNDLAVKLYPSGPPVRDAGHLALLEAFRRHVSSAFRWIAEWPLPGPRDPRAWDVGLLGAGVRIGVEGETNPDDLQALERRLAQKQKDGQVDRVILLIKGTERNRRLVREAGIGLRLAFPLDTHEVLRALREGRDPGANGIVFL